MLTEREQETALVARVLEDARRGGTGCVVTVSGPLGIGRSALLGALAEAAVLEDGPEAVLVLRAGGVRSERDFALGVLRRMLEPLPDAAVRLPARAETAEGLGDIEAARVRDEVLAHAAGRPLLVLVDDPHWADPWSARWLALLAESTEDCPVVLVVAGRHDRAGAAETGPLARIYARTAHELALRPLTRAGVERVITDCFGEPGDDAFVRSCLAVSHGRPLFLTALVRSQRAAGRRPQSVAAKALRACRPAAVGARAVQALAVECPPVKETAYALAVLGEPAGPGVLTPLTGLTADECTAALAALAAAGLVERGEPAWFAHAAIADAVENSLPASETAERHLRAARVLAEAGRPPEEVARHLLAAENPPTGWAIGLLKAAGRDALQRGDLATARRCLLRALLGATAGGPERAELLVDLATVERSSAPVASLRHLTQALPGLTTRGRRARELAMVPPLALELAPPSLTAYFAAAAVELGADADRDLRLALEARLRYARLGELRPFTETVAEFGRLDPSATPGSPAHRDLAAVLVHAATLAGEDAPRCARIAREVVLGEAPSPADARTAVPLAVRSLLALDLLDQADSWLTSLTVLARRQWGDAAAETQIALAERAYSLARRGWHTEAATLAARTLDRADPAFTAVAVRCCETLALIVAEAVVPDLARRTLSAFRARENALIPAWLGNLVDGVVAASNGDAEVALEHLLDCGREYDLMGWGNPAVLPWRTWAARLHHRLGAEALAHDLIEEEHERAAAWGAPTAHGRALRVWASMTEGPRALDLVREAIAVLDGSFGVLELAKAHILLGRRLAATDRAASAEHLARGEQLAKACGVADVHPHGEAGTGSHPADLTPAETRIARLVLAGQANQRIAEDLEISLRAVEKHLTKVYRKLGIAGRGGLPDVAYLLEPADAG
ncbi:AAA family ATPase [Amycolatopsis rhabdoformis]|uniref:AAA family ATPase n=1 Tax=Amycolatopsis rhabdoformis TaxID=1448059 RepID=A0ABZ1IEQ3_9PSEU|nr:AAA family ATPase [Amycolatopsis rhabdoformis]WSE32907.1 AAA family ATPase [Amycolatopsis rhabdoformis]